MVDMLGKKVAGYEIIRQGDQAVIGMRNTDFDPYVSWSYNQETGDCFWGRYGTEESVNEAFVKKERGMYSGG